MPVHNGAKYLQPAIDSILQQSFRTFEFIIVDDCSTDETVEIVNGCSDKRIRLIRSKDRLKLAGALNLGLKEAKSEFVARMDCDDISLPGRLQRQVDFMLANEDLGLCGTWVKYFPGQKNKVQEYPVEKHAVHALSLFHSPFAHPTVMMRRRWFEQHSLDYDVNYYPTEDFDLWSRALSIFAGANLGEVQLHYRAHEQSLTGSDWNNMDEQAARITQRALHALGLPSDLEASRYHRKVAMVRFEQTPEELDKAASWLRAILEANHKKKVYNQTALTRILEDLWHRCCMHCATAGLWPIRFYLQNRFEASQMAKYGMILTASCFKHYCKRDFT